MRRERGLTYIIDKIEKDGSVGAPDIKLLIEDLNLPDMEVEEIDDKIKEVTGGISKKLQSLCEFFEFISNEVVNSTDQESVIAFKVFDKDESGFINSAELRHAMSHLGDALNPEEIDQIIKISDLDGDGTINYEEVIKIMSSTESEFWNTFKAKVSNYYTDDR